MVGQLELEDPAQVGPYQMVGRLGGGGMGQVFLGRSAGGRLVAVKVIRTDLAEESGFRARFAQEVSAARKVSGMYTAIVVDADVTGPVPWLATEYVPGPSLAAAVAEHGPLPVSSVLRLAAGLAEGLGVIHTAGVVHRDLTPSNVLLADDGPRVIDFGISRAREASALTQSGMVVGSPGFMSPEQTSGQPVGPASDVFSLGAVLTFATTGQGPFGRGSMYSMLYRVVHAEPEISHLPAEIRSLVRRCLAKDPVQRPSPADLVAELEVVAEQAEWPPAAVAKVRWPGRLSSSAPALAGPVPVGIGYAAAAPPEPAASDCGPVTAPVAMAPPLAAAAGARVDQTGDRLPQLVAVTAMDSVAVPGAGRPAGGAQLAVVGAVAAVADVDRTGDRWPQVPALAAAGGDGGQPPRPGRGDRPRRGRPGRRMTWLWATSGVVAAAVASAVVLAGAAKAPGAAQVRHLGHPHASASASVSPATTAPSTPAAQPTQGVVMVHSSASAMPVPMGSSSPVMQMSPTATPSPVRTTPTASPSTKPTPSPTPTPTPTATPTPTSTASPTSSASPTGSYQSPASPTG